MVMTNLTAIFVIRQLVFINLFFFYFFQQFDFEASYPAIDIFKECFRTIENCTSLLVHLLVECAHHLLGGLLVLKKSQLIETIGSMFQQSRKLMLAGHSFVKLVVVAID